ncbi:MAG: hypothetical protein ACM3OO_13325 [Planctomycetaceae bacterium]
MGQRDDDDRVLGASLADVLPDIRRLWGSAWDHAEAWEYDIFPHLMMAADEDDLARAAARGDEAVRARGMGSSERA